MMELEKLLENLPESGSLWGLILALDRKIDLETLPLEYLEQSSETNHPAISYPPLPSQLQLHEFSSSEEQINEYQQQIDAVKDPNH